MQKNVSHSILFASTNQGKILEMKQLGLSCGVDIIAPSDLTPERAQRLGVPAPLGRVPEVIEDQPNYAGNARKKANALFNWSGVSCLGDDSGLEVHCLNNAPGVYSARYAGEQGNMPINIAKLLEVMRGKKERKARFVCVLCLVVNGSREQISQAEISGEIAREPRGSGGFGYDSLFIVDGTNKTLAELKQEGAAVKTHRELAFERMFKAKT